MVAVGIWRNRTGIAFVLGLLMALALGATAANSANAALVWKVNGKVLAAGETATAKTVGKYFMTWKRGVRDFTILCLKTTLTEELKGGNPGTDELKAGDLKLEECAALEPGGCTLTGTTAEGFPWKTKLELFLGHKFDLTEDASLKFTLSLCASSRNNGEWTLFGARLAGVLVFTGGRLEITFPNGIVEAEELGDELEVHGGEEEEEGEEPTSEVLVSAEEAELALEGGGTLEVGEESEGAKGSSLLVLSGEKVAELKYEGKSTTSKLEASGGRALTCEAGTAVASFKELEGKAADSSAGEETVDFTKCKQEKVGCRSENSKGEKDPVETVLLAETLQLANEKSTAKALEPLLVGTILPVSGTGNLVVNCGAVKEEVKGKVGCLLLPGLKELATSETAEVKCKLEAPGKQVTGECFEPTALCKELSTNPLLGTFGGKGFEALAEEIQTSGTFNKMAFLDD